MKLSPLRSFATFAALRFNVFASASTVIDRRYISMLALCLVSSVAEASITWTGPTWNVSTAIPDNDDVGLTNNQTVNIAGITEIESVVVNLNFAGGWNGDLYAYLVHDSGFSVLLNRPGRSLLNPDGSSTVGMDITFDDSAFSDVHTSIPMSGGSASGTYQPDGRITDPLLVLNTDARPAMLSSFIGIDANGNWTLFVADQSAGEQSILQSWSLTVTGVPEPSSALLVLFSGSLLLTRRRRA